MTDYPECPICGHIQDRDIFISEEEIDCECDGCGSSIAVMMHKSFEVFIDQEVVRNDEY
jgi:translation initiation factor 2 beta subunit (eIF-2beta)/eIF-5